VAALHQGAPGQMTSLEDPPPWLKPCPALRIAYGVGGLCFEGNVVNFFEEKKCIRVTCLEDYLTWLLYCASAATV